MNKHKDLLGQEIKVGDYITYSAVDGRSGVLRIAKVLELKEVKDKYEDDDIKYKVLVQSWSNFHGLQEKKVTLGFLDRIIVINKSIVSQYIIDAIESGIEWKKGAFSSALAIKYPEEIKNLIGTDGNYYQVNILENPNNDFNTGWKIDYIVPVLVREK